MAIGPLSKKEERASTMRDVAAMAGVSTATVSRVLNGSPLVDPATAKKVQQIIGAVQYIPNGTGKALKSGRSGIYGLVLPLINNPFFADFVRCFEQQIVTHRMEMLLALSDHREETMTDSIRRFLMRGVDGVVLLQAPLGAETYEALLRKRVPVATMNRFVTGPGLSDVGINPEPAMREAIELLRQLGHHRIGFLGGRESEPGHQDRDRAFREAMRANGLPVDEAAVRFCGSTVEGGEAALHDFLNAPDPVSAVLCVNDLTAVGAYRALAVRGKVAGRDFSVVGLDDTDLVNYLTPRLASIRVDRMRLAELYLDALARFSSKANRTGKQYWLETQFLRRDSVGPGPSAPSRGRAR